MNKSLQSQGRGRGRGSRSRGRGRRLAVAVGFMQPRNVSSELRSTTSRVSWFQAHVIFYWGM